MTEFKVKKNSRSQEVVKSEQMLQVYASRGARGGKSRYKLMQRDTLKSGSMKQRLVGAGIYQKGSSTTEPNVWVEMKAKAPAEKKAKAKAEKAE